MKDVRLKLTVKHGGGSIIVWGCLIANGVGDLVRILGIVNAEKYLQILVHHTIPSGKHLISNGFIFQSNNDLKHTALKVKSYLEQKEQSGDVQIMKWSPQSPDLNIIESLWDYLDQRKATKQPKSNGHLCQFLQDAWDNILLDYINKLQLSISKRINAVLAAKGRHTKYQWYLSYQM